jgi:hypothetical protein
MGPGWLDLLVVLTACGAATWAAFRRGLVARRRPPEPAGRPLEDIVADARRLAPRALHPPRGTSRTKVVALRYAYDHVLSEACAALGIDHLLGVLDAGDELDAERARVESLLWLAGVRIDDEAA